MLLETSDSINEQHFVNLMYVLIEPISVIFFMSLIDVFVDIVLNFGSMRVSGKNYLKPDGRKYKGMQTANRFFKVHCLVQIITKGF